MNSGLEEAFLMLPQNGEHILLIMLPIFFHQPGMEPAYFLLDCFGVDCGGGGTEGGQTESQD